MTLDLSSVDSASFVPRMLIAETNEPTADSLIRTIGNSRLNVQYDVCSTHDHAVIQLFRSPPPYHLVISNVNLAELDDFFLVTHNRLRQPAVPFVITTGAAGIEPSRRALDKGAFDVIATPLEPEQTVATIRLALWHSQLRALIASRERLLETYRHIIATYPPDWKNGEALQGLLASMQATRSSSERSLKRIEETFVKISDLATEVAHYTRTRALERLKALAK